MMNTLEQNPVGLDGIEFIEYATSRPQALGQVLESMGFRPIARHRSREITLYRQGDLNLIVNSHGDSENHTEKPVIAAIALRVRDAAAALARAVALGAWHVPTKVEVMELNIPAIHGVGSSRIYFVDRYDTFSIYDVDFTPIPLVDQHPPAVAGIHFFGLVQYIGNDRSDDWMEFYRQILGFSELPSNQRFGIMPKGRILQSPSADQSPFYIQLIEPEKGFLDVNNDEGLHRIGLGCPDVSHAVAALREHGAEFTVPKHQDDPQAILRGALMQTKMGNVSFELVQNAKP